MIEFRLLAVGAAHLDRRGHISGKYVPAASNPGTMREEVGGGAFNALRNAKRHGITGTILSLRGGDLAGDTVARAVDHAEINDLSVTFLDRTTPSYTALIDADGELIAGFADMGLYDAGFPRQVRRRSFRDAVATTDAVLCDANMPAEALTALAGLAREKPLYGVAISPAKVVRFEPILPRLACLFMNVREAHALADISMDEASDLVTTKLRNKGLASAVITAGGETLHGFDEAGAFRFDIPRAELVNDVTGAGDAVAGTTTAYLMRGLPLRQALRYGIAAATLTVACATVVAEYDDNAFAAALARVPAAQDLQQA